MLAKEWRDARWKLAVAASAFLVLVAVLPKTYELVQRSVEREVALLQRELASPDLPEMAFGPGAPKEFRTPESYKESLRRDIERFQSPGYPAKAAGQEIKSVQQLGNYTILIPLAGLLGVALVSGEVSGSSIYLLLSKPASRGRVLLVRYAVCAGGLFAVAVVGALGIIVSAFVHGYPSGAVSVGAVAGSAALIWLGSLFVLGVALLASVMFGDVIRTLLATVATMYLVLAGPDLVRGAVEGLFWSDSDYGQSFREQMAWDNAFETFRLSNYWGGLNPYTGETVLAQSFLVCLLTALPPLLLALWLFRRKAF